MSEEVSMQEEIVEKRAETEKTPKRGGNIDRLKKFIGRRKTDESLLPEVRGDIARIHERIDPPEIASSTSTSDRASENPSVPQQEKNKKPVVAGEVVYYATGEDKEDYSLAMEKCVEFLGLTIPEGQKPLYLEEIPAALKELTSAKDPEQKLAAREQLTTLIAEANLPPKKQKELESIINMVLPSEVPVGGDETIPPAPVEDNSPEGNVKKSITELLQRAAKIADSEESSELKRSKLQDLLLKLNEIGDTKLPHKWYLPFAGGKTVKENAWGILGILMTITAGVIIAYIAGVASLGKAGGKG